MRDRVNTSSGPPMSGNQCMKCNCSCQVATRGVSALEKDRGLSGSASGEIIWARSCPANANLRTAPLSRWRGLVLEHICWYKLLLGLKHPLTCMWQTSQIVAMLDSTVTEQIASFNALLFNENAIIIDFGHRVALNLHEDAYLAAGFADLIEYLPTLICV
jgi:hypothetical protein